MLKVKLEEGGIAPKKAYEGDAGYDLFIPTNYNSFELKLGDKLNIPLQIRIEGERGYYYRVVGKSGLSKKGLLVYEGVIDNNYRGVISAEIQYLGKLENILTFKPGDKIAQLIICPCIDTTNIECIDTINMETIRGEGGFGSTGK